MTPIIWLAVVDDRMVYAIPCIWRAEAERHRNRLGAKIVGEFVNHGEAKRAIAAVLEDRGDAA